MRTITIEAALNGFVCQVGCTRVVYTSVDDLLKELGRYLRDPAAVEKDYCETAVNHRLIQHPIGLGQVCEAGTPGTINRRPLEPEPRANR